MALIIQKYGGTSVGNLDRIRNVATKVMQTKAQGHDVVVVVSAMSGETDRLISLAKSIQEQPNQREYAVLLSTGEQVAIALLTMALMSRGCNARSYTGMQARIQTDANHKKARILGINCHALQQDLTLGFIPVVAGFQGVAENGDITTLGRGGSDTTAVALAAALKADECQIYTDVDGIYTADPNVVPKAQRLDSISFNEMLELSSLGAKVVQQRAVEFAGKYQVPLRVLSTFVDGPGTLVNFNEKGIDQAIISGIACNRFEARLTLNTIPQKPNAIADIVANLANEHIEIDMLVQKATKPGTIDITFTVSRDEFAKAFAVLEDQAKIQKAGSVEGDTKIAKISLVGVGLRSHPAIIGTLYKCFGRHNIAIQLISTSEIKVSAVIDEAHVEHGIRELHSAYGLDHKDV